MELTEITPSSSAVTSPAQQAGDLGQTDFLRMLVVQLENQDPLDPQDATEFTAQLAQFSSLDQLISMRTSIDNLAAVGLSSQLFTAAGLIGRQVLAPTASFSVDADPAEPLPELHVELAEPATQLFVEVVDEIGQVAARATFTGLSEGVSELDWSAFDTLPSAGDYSFRVTVDIGDASPTSLVRARVTGASLDAGTAVLVVGGVTVPMSEIREVSR